MSEWKPISEAPIDDIILAYFPYQPPGRDIRFVRWSGWGGGIWQCAATGHNIMEKATNWMIR